MFPSVKLLSVFMLALFLCTTSWANDPRNYTDDSRTGTGQYFTEDDVQKLVENIKAGWVKRTPAMSVNQDLVSLASMAQNEAGRRRLEAAHSLLSRIGKRGGRLNGLPTGVMDDLQSARQHSLVDRRRA